jgi:hypothetical protein
VIDSHEFQMGYEFIAYAGGSESGDHAISIGVREGGGHSELRVRLILPYDRDLGDCREHEVDWGHVNTAALSLVEGQGEFRFASAFTGGRSLNLCLQD